MKKFIKELFLYRKYLKGELACYESKIGLAIFHYKEIGCPYDFWASAREGFNKEKTNGFQSSLKLMNSDRDLSMYSEKQLFKMFKHYMRNKEK